MFLVLDPLQGLPELEKYLAWKVRELNRERNSLVINLIH